jgi:hypothetical protein
MGHALFAVNSTCMVTFGGSSTQSDVLNDVSLGMPNRLAPRVAAHVAAEPPEKSYEEREKEVGYDSVAAAVARKKQEAKKREEKKRRKKKGRKGTSTLAPLPIEIGKDEV